MTMTNRRPCPPAPGPLEAYAAAFDPVLGRLPQRRGFRDYLVGLLAPRDRNKTLTGLADTEPVAGAQHREAQRLQFFLSESSWDHEQVNRVRVRLLGEDPATRPHAQGVLVIDDTGDRKDGPAMAHVARQYLGSVGKTDQGIVVVTSLWADEHAYWPVDLAPYTPASRLPGGEREAGVCHQAPTGGGADCQGQGRGDPVSRGRGRLRLWRQPQLRGRAGRQRDALGAGV